MALEGTLQDFSIADILQLIGLQRKTGTLTLAGQEDTVTVLFELGRIVGAESEAKHLEDRLGHVLLKTGKLTQGELHRILRIQKETGQRIGAILLKKRAVTRDDLIRALQLQVTQILFRLFRWATGHYHFSQSGQVDYDKHCFEPIPVEDILMEGLRILDEWPLIEKRVGSFSLVYAVADARRRVETDDSDEEDVGSALDVLLGVEDEPHGSASDDVTEAAAPASGEAETVTVSAQEEVVYRLLNRRYTVQDVIDRSDLGEFETCKALFQLLEKDLIVEVTTNAKAAPAQRSLPGRIDRAGAFVLAILLVGMGAGTVWATGSFSAQGLLGRVVAPFQAGEALENLQLAASQNRIARLEFALRVYAMQRGSFPRDLGELASMGLVSDADLSDPWGTRYAYVLTQRNFQIRGVDGAGHEHPALILTGRLPSVAVSGVREQSRLAP